MKSFTTTIFVFLSAAFSVSAQMKLNNETSNLYVDGTSTLHDWTENAEVITGSMSAVLAGNKIEKIKSIHVEVPVESLKSGKSGMDKNTYKALKSSDHPKITFVLKSYGFSGSTVSLTGDMTIAGTKKSVKLMAEHEVNNGRISLEGKYTFKMTDFNVEPPTAMMGTIKTGDEITVRFNLDFE